MQLLQELTEQLLERSNIMGQDNKNTFNVLQGPSLRNIVEQANNLGLTKDNIVQVIPMEGGFFLLYYK